MDTSLLTLFTIPLLLALLSKRDYSLYVGKLITPLYGDVFEFLSSFIEFMQLDPPVRKGDILKHLVDAYRSLIKGLSIDRNTLLLLYRTKVLVPCSRGIAKLKVFKNVEPVDVCLKSKTSSNELEVEEEITNAMLNWHPIKILVRYLAWKGGSASINDIVKDLGCCMKRLTSELFDALKLVIPDERVLKTPRRFLSYVKEICGEDVDERGVLKPFNKRRVEELLVPILKSLKLVELDKDIISLTDLGIEYSRHIMMIPQSELVITEPLFPQTYAALLSVLYRSSRSVYIISPWVEVTPSGSGLLLSLLRTLKDRFNEIVMVLRDDEHNRRVLRNLLRNNALSDLPISIYLVKNLHAKMYVSIPALVTSANLLFTSIGINYEVGLYYPVAPKDLIEFKDLLLSAAIKIKSFD